MPGSVRKTFGVELETEQRILAVADAHDLVIAVGHLGPGTDDEFFGQGIRV